MKLMKRWASALSATALMISLFALSVFADDGNGGAGLSTTAIVWIVIGGILLIAGVVLGIKFREKIVKGLRVLKSEFKKVSWLSWEQTRKSTWIVLIVLVVAAVVICLLDYVLFEGLKWLVLNVPL